MDAVAVADVVVDVVAAAAAVAVGAGVKRAVEGSCVLEGEGVLAAHAVEGVGYVEEVDVT